jgi:error-prone DNA polymerase
VRASLLFLPGFDVSIKPGAGQFQEQLMQLAIDVAGFDAGDADQLRRAMGSKRSPERMAKLKTRLYAGMAARGITGELADDPDLKLSVTCF